MNQTKAIVDKTRQFPRSIPTTASDSLMALKRENTTQKKLANNPAPSRKAPRSRPSTATGSTKTLNPYNEILIPDTQRSKLSSQRWHLHPPTPGLTSPRLKDASLSDEQEEREREAERSSPAGRGRGPLLRGAVAAWTRRPWPRIGRGSLASAEEEGPAGRRERKGWRRREGKGGEGLLVFLDKNLGLGWISGKEGGNEGGF